MKRTKRKKIVLYGAGGFARELAYMIETINKLGTFPKYHLLGFVVDKEYYTPETTVNGYPVLGTDEWLQAHKDEVVCTCAIGENPQARKEIQERLESQGVTFETLIAAGVAVPPTTTIGAGSILCDGVFLSVNMTVGKGVVVNARSSFGHDVVIGDYTCIMGAANITGNVWIGKCAFIGGAAYIIPKRKIGNHALVAAGSVVFTNVKDGTKVLGNPAKRMDI